METFFIQHKGDLIPINCITKITKIDGRVMPYFKVCTIDDLPLEIGNTKDSPNQIPFETVEEKRNQLVSFLSAPAHYQHDNVDYTNIFNLDF